MTDGNGPARAAQPQDDVLPALCGDGDQGVQTHLSPWCSASLRILFLHAYDRYVIVITP